MTSGAPRRIGLLTILSGLAAAAVLILFMTVCIRKGNDFQTFYELGRMTLHHEGQIYISTASTGMTVPYLPHFFLLMIPWALIPLVVSAGLWFWMKVGLLVAMLLLFRSWTNRDTRTERLLITLLPLLICIDFLNGDFRLGQCNLIVTALLLLAFLSLRKGKNALGALLFVASSFKITPLAMLPYFIVRKQWRFLLAVLGWAAIFAVVFIAWFGWQESAAVPSRFTNLIESHKLGLLQVAEVRNQSLFGAIARSATHATEASDGEITLKLKSNVAPARTYDYLTYTFCFALMLLVCLWTWRRRSRGLDLTEFSVFLIVTLLISPDTRSAHMVNLLVPSFVLVSSLEWKRFSLRHHWWLIFILVVLFLTSRDLAGRAIFNWSLYFSIQTVMLLMFLVLLMVRRNNAHLEKQP